MEKSKLDVLTAALESAGNGLDIETDDPYLTDKGARSSR
jgi:hypothetical protein